MRRRIGIFLAVPAIILASCSSPASPELQGGVLATFDVLGERYCVFITRGETIAQVEALADGRSEARIPSGRLVRGAVPYNPPWSWHIDPEGLEMAEVSIELCDGRPSDVEHDLDYWAGTVGRFCPWAAVLVSLEDFR